MGHPRGKLAEYAQNVLPPAEHEAVGAHVRGCPACQEEVTGHRVLLRAFAGQPQVESPLEIQGILARAKGDSTVAAPAARSVRAQVAVGVLAGALAGMAPLLLPQGVSCTPGRFSVHGAVMVAGQPYANTCVLEGVQLGVVDAMPVKVGLRAADVVLSPGSRARVGEDGRALEVQQGTVWVDGTGVRVDTVFASVTLMEKGALEVAVEDHGSMVSVRVRAGRARVVKPEGGVRELGPGEDTVVRAPRVASL